MSAETVVLTHCLNRLYAIDAYTVVSRIYAPLCIQPPLHFRSKFLHGYFYLANSPPLPPPPPSAPNHGHATKIATPTLSSSRWIGNARTKPASTKQLRNVPTIASMFASGVNATAHWGRICRTLRYASCNFQLVMSLLGMSLGLKF